MLYIKILYHTVFNQTAIWNLESLCFVPDGFLSGPLKEVHGVLKSLEETLADVQRVDAKAQSAFDVKKQNLKDETKKRKELVKSMEEVMGQYCRFSL